MARVALKEPEVKFVKVQFGVDQASVDNLRRAQVLHRDETLAQAFRRAAATQCFVDEELAKGSKLLLQTRRGRIFAISFPS